MKYAIYNKGGKPVEVEPNYPVRLLFWSLCPDYVLEENGRLSFTPDYNEVLPISDITAKYDELSASFGGCHESLIIPHTTVIKD